MRSIGAMASIVLAACGGSAPRAGEAQGVSAETPSSSETSSGSWSSDLAPAPYTAEELRRGNPAGRSRTYLRSEAGGEPVLERMTFVESTERGGTFESIPIDASGQAIGEARRGSASWEELRSHAAYPGASTTITDEEIVARAGRFACRRYEVVESTPEGVRTTRAWFTTDPVLAGPPIRMEVAVGDATVMTMELVDWGPRPR